MTNYNGRAIYVDSTIHERLRRWAFNNDKTLRDAAGDACLEYLNTRDAEYQRKIEEQKARNANAAEKREAKELQLAQTREKLAARARELRKAQENFESDRS